MRVVLTIMLFVAFAAALGAAYLASDYLARQRDLARQGAEPLPTFTGQRVMVAARQIEAGTAMRDSLVRWQPWPPEDILSGYKVIGSTEGETEAQIFAQRNRLEQTINGKIVRRLIAPGEPVTDSMLFNREEAGFMAGALEPGKVAISVSVTATSGASGFIKPGDRVDVLLTHDLGDVLPRDIMDRAGQRGVAKRRVTETIIESLRVLAVDQTFKENEGDPQVVDTITVEVDPSQAETIALAKTMGAITLVLRGLSDIEKPVGLAALLGLGGPRGAMNRPVVSDLTVSPEITRMIEIAGEAGDFGDIADLRERLEQQRAAQQRLEEQLQLERAERARLEEELSRPDGVAPVSGSPAWSVTVHRVQGKGVQTETIGTSPAEAEPAEPVVPDLGPSAPATVGALPGADIPPDEILIQE